MQYIQYIFNVNAIYTIQMRYIFYVNAIYTLQMQYIFNVNAINTIQIQCILCKCNKHNTNTMHIM